MEPDSSVSFGGISDSAERWQLLRRRLNHDWLSNEILPAGEALRNMFLGLVDDSELNDAASHVSGRWRGFRDALVLLAYQGETSIGPGALFSLEPLRACGSDTRAWLEPRLRDAWLVGTNFAAVCEEIREASAEADKAIATAVFGLCGNTDRAAALAAVDLFIAKCRDLRALVAQLPRHQAIW